MIDPKKTYRTRDGREVRIYAVDGGLGYPVHGAWSHNGAAWCATEWYGDGASATNVRLDLIEVRPKRTLDVWVNVYRDCVSVGHGTKRGADASAVPNHLTCLHIVREYEEGEGL